MLNAQSTIAYPYTAEAILDMVNVVDPENPEQEASLLAEANNLGCPLD